MANNIQLMPEHLANQIAAGEVIQRPASAVKELLENALDADATEIQLIIEDAGKKLIQVVDNGTGMSAMDARMSFERHATSKIRNIEDLFSIHTMGFRGEALASIAAVAQVELKTKRPEDELGIQMHIESGAVKSQEPTSFKEGTSLSIRNLFYDLPARKKFLKSNTTEYKHILDEFTRIAMAFPQKAFRLFKDGTEQLQLKKSNLKGRIVDIIGDRVEKNLIPVSEDTDLIKISGFVGKPAAAKKRRGNQFFFVNNRFIRSPYLNHAVRTAFEDLIDKESYPLYVLRLRINPERVDVNVHPSKQEVKFDDEQMIYAYLKSTIKHGLAKFNIAPSIDFSLDQEIQNSDALQMPFSKEKREEAGSGYLAKSFSQHGQAHRIDTQKDRQDWEQQRQTFFSDIDHPKKPTYKDDDDNRVNGESPHQEASSNILNWTNYLMTTVKSGFLLIHKRRAKERIIFEKLQRKMINEKPTSQQLLFPFEMSLNPTEAALAKEAMPFFRSIGFTLTLDENKKITISGLPQGLSEQAAKEVLSELLEELQVSPLALKDPLKKKLLQKMAVQMAAGDEKAKDEDNLLIDELFACQDAQNSPSGKMIYRILSKDNLKSWL